MTEVVAAPVADETDVRARDILHTLVNISRFVEGDEYAQNLTSNFGNFVILDGAKDRGILPPSFSFSFFFILYHSVTMWKICRARLPDWWESFWEKRVR